MTLSSFFEICSINLLLKGPIFQTISTYFQANLSKLAQKLVIFKLMSLLQSEDVGSNEPIAKITNFCYHQFSTKFPSVFRIQCYYIIHVQSYRRISIEKVEMSKLGELDETADWHWNRRLRDNNGGQHWHSNEMSFRWRTPPRLLIWQRRCRCLLKTTKKTRLVYWFTFQLHRIMFSSITGCHLDISSLLTFFMEWIKSKKWNVQIPAGLFEGDTLPLSATMPDLHSLNFWLKH